MAALTESAHQHRRRVVVKNGVWFKAIYIASVLVGKKFIVVARTQQRFPHGVCGRKNLFSCWQISYHAGSSFVEDIPIIKRPQTIHKHTDADTLIYIHEVHKSEAKTFQREKKI